MELLRRGIFWVLFLAVYVSCFILQLFIHLAFSQYHLGITELDIEPYLEDEGTGDLRYVQVNCLAQNRRASMMNSVNNLEF